jgi:hypothetical protein
MNGTWDWIVVTIAGVVMGYFSFVVIFANS